MTNANTRTNERQSLFDTKGLGKPPMFKCESVKFAEWLRRTAGLLVAACGSVFRPLIESVEGQKKSEQDHAALLALTKGRSFNIAFGAAPSSLEALRRPIRRWDDLNGEKAQSTSAANLGSRSVRAARLSCRTPEVGSTGVPMRAKHIRWNDDSSRNCCARAPRTNRAGTTSSHEPCTSDHV